MKKPNCWLFVTILFLAPFICAIELLAAVPAKKIRLVYSAFAYANPPFWIAHDVKLFEKYGLDPELDYVSGARPIQAMLGGSTDVSQVGGAATVTAADRLKRYALANLIGNPLETNKVKGHHGDEYRPSLAFLSHRSTAESRQVSGPRTENCIGQR